MKIIQRISSIGMILWYLQGVQCSMQIKTSQDWFFRFVKAAADEEEVLHHDCNIHMHEVS